MRRSAALEAFDLAIALLASAEQELRKDAAELSAPQARHLCVQLAERTAHVRRSVLVLKEDLEGSEEG